MSKQTAKVVRLSDLVPDARNANKGTLRGLAMLDDSLREDGAGRGILLDRNNNVVAGNKTLERAVDLGYTEIIVVPTDGKQLVATQRVDVDLDSPQGRRMGLRDNRVGQVDLEFDADVLKSLQDDGLDLSTLWDADELAALLASVDGDAPPADPGAQMDRVAELQVKWQVQPGDVWRIPSKTAKGEHRLVCGDCTDRAVVERVMRGERADMMFTDPPYGVDYEGGHFHSGNVNIKRERDKLSGDGSPALYARFLPIVLPVIDGPCYMFFADREGLEPYTALHDTHCEIHALIIWHKTNATYAAMNAQYKQRHEPCLYFKPRGSTLRWVGPTDECTLWEMDRNPSNELHPTQKPVELVVRAIKNHDAKMIIDPFLGSGTTLVACEQTGRLGRGCEIEPKYCAVILERLAGLGLSPERAS